MAVQPGSSILLLGKRLAFYSIKLPSFLFIFIHYVCFFCCLSPEEIKITSVGVFVNPCTETDKEGGEHQW